MSIEQRKATDKCLTHLLLAPERHSSGVVVARMVGEGAGDLLGYAVVPELRHGKLEVEAKTGVAILLDELDAVGDFFSVYVDPHVPLLSGPM